MMNKNLMIVLGVVVVLFVSAFMVVAMFFSYNNAEARQRNLIVASQKDAYSQLDNTVKTISQSAQVTQAQTQALRDIIVGNAEARASSKGGGAMATLVHEAVPNLDSSTQTFRNLQNQIVAARNTWTTKQKELLDQNRVHDDQIDTYPSRFFVHTLGGKDKIEIQIVTSTRTENSFKTGKDDNDQVFQK